MRNWLSIAILAGISLPAILLRVLGVELNTYVEVATFGGAILSAAFLTWASEVAETEMSATLALAVLAIIAVLPEYAVDLYFAWTAHTNPDNAHFAIANMTGANRLLVGFAWPMIFLIFWLQTRKRSLTIDGTQNGMSIIFLGVATVQFIYTDPGAPIAYRHGSDVPNLWVVYLSNVADAATGGGGVCRDRRRPSSRYPPCGAAQQSGSSFCSRRP